MRRKSASVSRRPLVETLEIRQHLSATGVKVIDTGGPLEQMVESGGQIFTASSHASGAGITQIHVASGPKSKTRLLLDLTASGSTISSIDHLAATGDGRIFFTASTIGGRHVFQLNTRNGGYTQITSGTNQFYHNLVGASDRLYAHESNGKTLGFVGPGTSTFTGFTTVVPDGPLVAHGSDIYFTVNNPSEQSLYRSNGTAAGTKKVSGNFTTSRNDFFVTNEAVYFEGRLNNDISFYRTLAGETSPQLLAQDFFLPSPNYAEVGDHVYFSGGFYNTSPNAKGWELYKVNTVTGALSVAADVMPGSAGAAPAAVAAVGNSIYFTGSDGEYITSQGTGDRELYRFDTITGKTVQVTKGNVLYPLEMGGGVLNSYYFVAAPTKDDARWGSRLIYRTNPVTDEVEAIGGVPVIKNASGVDHQEVDGIAVGSRGIFFRAFTGDRGRDKDVFFAATPFSLYDPKTTILTITATPGSDNVTMRVDGAELVVTLNGLEERHELAKVQRIEAFLGDGNDVFTADPNVFVNTYVFGDLGDDLITTGSGHDTISGGAGKNRLFGSAGNDRVNGSNGRDYLDGGEGEDRLYGKGGNDTLFGGAGVDRLFGDDETGPFGDDVLMGGSSNDKIYGYGGNDTLYGGRQNDLLYGGAGNDVIYGDEGNDTLDGGAGIDTLFGGFGDDLIYAADGQKDFIHGEDGYDIAYTDASEQLVDLIEELR